MIDGLGPYPAYGPSGVPALRDVPSHWRMLRGKTLFRESDERAATGREDLLSVSHISGVRRRSEGNATMFLAKSNKSHKLCRPNDLVINTMWAWMGALGVAQDTGLVSPAYGVYRLLRNSPLTPNYAHHLLRTPQYVREFTNVSTGIHSSRLRLYPQQFLRMPIIVPPPEEQAAIVRFLDHTNRRIDAFIRAKRKLIVLLNEQKQSIADRALTQGIDPSCPTKDCEFTWLGKIPAHWELRRAKQVCAAIIDCKNRTPELIADGEFRVIRTTNVRHGRFSLRGSYTTDRHNFELWTERGAPRSGDVFFTREAPAGEACLVPDLPNICMGQRMMYLRPQKDVLDSRFLLRSIYGPVGRTYIQLACNGSTVGHLRLGQVGSLPLLWCPLPEQVRIARFIDDATEPLNVVIERAEREIALMREYRTRLISDVVTGQLDVREAARALPDLDPAATSPDPDLDPSDEEEAGAELE